MTTVDKEVLDHLVLLATRAPSIHNTQPWRLERRPEGLAVYADRSRQLAVLDPLGRQLALSCGAVTHHLEVAARGLALTAEVHLLPDPDDADFLALVALSPGAEASPDEVSRAVDILHRHTARGRFTSEQLPYGLVARLRTAVEHHQAMLRLLHPEETVAVAMLVDRAEEELTRTPGYLNELKHWVWPADRVDVRPDGIPQEAVDPGTDRAEAIRGRDFSARPTSRSTDPGAAEHPTVILLTTEGDTVRDWLQAGRALSALLLESAHAGVVAQPFGQVSDLATTRMALRRQLGVIGMPQLLLRLGHDDSPLRTPRRPLEDVLADAHGTTPEGESVG